jgi:hypothetical protein
VESIRCLIADIPQKVLADIVQSMTQQDEKIDVVGQVSGIHDVPGILNSEKIDVLIMGMRDSTPHQFCRDMLEKFPGLLVVGLIDDGRMAVACWADVGKSDILGIIRAWHGADKEPM